MNSSSRLHHFFSAFTINQNKSSPFAISLRTLLLITVVIAVWFGNWQLMNWNQQLKIQLNGLKSICRILSVENTEKVAVVGRLPTRFGENIFDVFIPSGRAVHLFLALDNIDFEKPTLAIPSHVQRLPEGFHSVEVRYNQEDAGSTIEIFIDNQVVINEKRPVGWDPGPDYSFGTGRMIRECVQTNDPLVFFCKRFPHVTGSGDANFPSVGSGILVWCHQE